MITLYVIFCIQQKSLALLYSFINFHCKNNLFTPFNINIKNQLSLDITSRHCSQICYTCSTKVYRLYFVHVFALAIKILNSWNMPHKPCWCMYMQCSSPLISSMVICQHIINYLQLLWYLAFTMSNTYYSIHACLYSFTQKSNHVTKVHSLAKIIL